MTQVTANGTKRLKAAKPPKPRAPKPAKDPEGRMPLAEHIRELRTRLFRASLAITAGAVVGWVIHNRVIAILRKPVCDVKDVVGVAGNSFCHSGTLTAQSPTDGLAVSLKVALMVGLIISSPVWLYQLWAFIAPGLHKNEKKYSLGFVGVAVPLFVGGAALCYVILPQIMSVLLGFTPQGVAVAIPLGTYIGTVTRMVLVFGCSMEIPLIVVALNFTGVLSAERLKKTWRYVTFVIFIFAAAAVPTGEPLGMTALAAPMCALYYSAIGIAVLNDRRRAARAAAAPSPDEASPLDLAPQSIEAARETRELTSRDYDDLT
jgi:sec-independent protein translocase protein TatC